MSAKTKPPTSILSKEVKVTPHTFISLASGLGKLIKLDFEEGIEKISNSFCDLKLMDDPEELAWLLVNKSVLKTFYKLSLSFRNDDEFNENHIDKFENDVVNILTDYSIPINQNFFNKPAENDLIKALVLIFDEYLKLWNIIETDRKNLINRFPREYVQELINEWNSNPEKYKKILTCLEKSPFYEFAQIENEWFRYNNRLQMLIEESLFFESFKIKDVYIQLRGYYNIKKKEEKTDNYKVEKHVVDVEEEILKWVNSENKDHLKVICGGPGYGKSTLFKSIASKLAYENDYQIIFIPLHLFNIQGNFQDSIRQFLKNTQGIKSDPFDNKKLLIIFDGLDEYFMNGKSFEALIQEFIGLIKSEVNLINSGPNLQMKILLSGRDIVIQKNEREFREEREIIHLLPYYVTKDELKNYVDKDNFLKIDQRDLWWISYGRCKKLNYTSMPDNLKADYLTDVTSFPLLNYLVALSYVRKNVTFNENTNINTIYEDLLKGVYDRKYSKHGKHKVVDKITFEEFIGLFEDISLSVWHCQGRNTTLKNINQDCQKRIKECFSDNQGIISLLVAFYFRKAGMDSQGDETFEFTHKSFAEYLTARKIVKVIKSYMEKDSLMESNGFKKQEIKDTCKEWTQLFGQKELDRDILKFIKNEFEIEYQKGSLKIDKLQIYIVELFNYVLKYGTQTELEEYNIAHSKAINSEKAFFYILGSISQITKKLSMLNWNNPTQFADLFSRLVGYIGFQSPTLFGYLCYLNLNYCLLYRIDLSFANLTGADIKEANLTGAYLIGAYLIKANLTEANLTEANLTGADLSTAIYGSNIKNAILSDTKLNPEMKNYNPIF